MQPPLVHSLLWLLLLLLGLAAAAETISASVLALTLIGGAGNQSLTSVGWEAGNCTQVFGQSSDGQFTIRYTNAGDFVSTTGSINVDAPMKDQFTNFAPAEGSTLIPNPSDGAGNTVMSIFYSQIQTNYQEPRLRLYRSADKKERNSSLVDMYRTYYFSAISNLPGNRGDARGIEVFPLPYGKFALRVWGDDGAPNVRDPRDCAKLNCACNTTGTTLCTSKGSTFLVAQFPVSFNGQPMPLYARSHGFRLDSWVVDDDGRFFIGSDEGSVNDPLGLGGQAACGITIYDQSLTKELYTFRLGCTAIHSIAIKGNLLVVGGKITSTDASALAGKFVKATQTTHGGGVYDGFLAVVQLTVSGTPDPLPATACSPCYCNGTEVSLSNQCISTPTKCLVYPANTQIPTGGNLGLHACGSHGPYQQPYPAITGLDYGTLGFSGNSVNAVAYGVGPGDAGYLGPAEDGTTFGPPVTSPPPATTVVVTTNPGGSTTPGTSTTPSGTTTKPTATTTRPASSAVALLPHAIGLCGLVLSGVLMYTIV